MDEKTLDMTRLASPSPGKSTLFPTFNVDAPLPRNTAVPAGKNAAMPAGAGESPSLGNQPSQARRSED